MKGEEEKVKENDKKNPISTHTKKRILYIIYTLKCDANPIKQIRTIYINHISCF